MKTFLLKKVLKKGGFVGISKNIDHNMIFKILNVSSSNIIEHSYICTTDNSVSVNLKGENLTLLVVTKLLYEEN